METMGKKQRAMRTTFRAVLLCSNARELGHVNPICRYMDRAIFFEYHVFQLHQDSKPYSIVLFNTFKAHISLSLKVRDCVRFLIDGGIRKRGGHIDGEENVLMGNVHKNHNLRGPDGI